MTMYYLGGYFLIKPKTGNFSLINSGVTLTCSECINDSLLSDWAYSWSQHGTDRNYLYKSLNTDPQTVEAIQHWANTALETSSIGFQGVFHNIATALAYKNIFFKELENVVIIGVYFDEHSMLDLIDDFTTDKEGAFKIGLCEMLEKKVPETGSANELELGFDLIGVEDSGDFHSFHCHGLTAELSSKFDITINEFGLIDKIQDQKALEDFMNDEANGFEPVPWYVAKLKLVPLA